MIHKVHLDTDLGGDIDDLCALAMLLAWETVEITGITTVAEFNGRRAGYVRHVLEMEGRQAIPIAAGADVAQGYYRYAELGYPDEGRYWSQQITSLPGQPEDAVSSLAEYRAEGNDYRDWSLYQSIFARPSISRHPKTSRAVISWADTCTQSVPDFRIGTMTWTGTFRSMCIPPGM